MGIFSWLRKILSYDPSVYKPPVQKGKEPRSSMTEGGFRSGPDGYLPNTEYPEAFDNSGESSDYGQDEGEGKR
jgi:hypothetical protein